MPRRVTPSQLRNMIRQAEQKQRQAINKYNEGLRKLNREIDKYNRESKRAVDNYNREVRAHNTRVRRNRQRLRNELSRLSSHTSRTRFVTYRTSVDSLHSAFVRVEAKADAGMLESQILDLTEGETANSVTVLNSLLDDAHAPAAEPDALRQTSLRGELSEISPDLDQRWRGALFALDQRNPDAARHFCASSREILARVIESEAPDKEVLRALPRCPKTQEGRPTRRARVQFFLHRKGLYDEDLEDFVEQDLENVVTLFNVFNEGTHGSAGAFTLAQLASIKQRVEDAIRFLHSVIR